MMLKYALLLALVSCTLLESVNASVTWPAGQWGLPKTTDGCPNPVSGSFTFEEGSRYQDLEDKDPESSWSDPHNLLGPYDHANMQRHFCMKMSANADADNRNWPAGQYCVYQKGLSCPSGMSGGYVYWDDEDKYNGNTASGTVPDGVYDRNTKIFFCCQTSGEPNTPISLPTEKPFMMFQYGCECQQVIGMTYTPEYFYWDTEDKDNSDGTSGSHPHPGVLGGKNIKLNYCYYSKIQ